MLSPDPQPSLLSLPPELRVRIYEYIFPRKPHITPHLKQPRDLSLAASILRTCRKFHTEASTVLYSRYTFLISNPERVLRWLSRIGPLNTTLLRTLRIWIDPVYSMQDSPFTSAKTKASWYKLLDRLAKEATGLQYVDIYWDAKPSCYRFVTGRDLDFLRELGKMRGVRSIVVGGFYGKKWPRCLIGVGVVGGLVRRDGEGGLEYWRG